MITMKRRAGESYEAFNKMHATFISLMDAVQDAANNRDDDNYMWAWHAAAHKVNRARAAFQNCQSISNEHAYAVAKIAAWYIDHLPALAAMLARHDARPFHSQHEIAPRHLHAIAAAQDILFDHGIFHGEQF